ncbi:MAG TPA: 3-isopropylmalate dehydratase small subunit [Thermoplasmata archaeon]|nr:3-isopropylmalate dehydratase small subunit [Thermoplasmata archaeon]
MSKIKGKAWVYGDHINTDVIFPGRYLHIFEPEEMAKHAMEDLDPEFVKNMEKGDMVFGGKNFGCGSSREQAVTCLKYAGVGAIVAKSFSRLYYRNAINQGMPIFECEEAVDGTESGDEVEIDFENGIIRNITKGKEFKTSPLPDFIMEIIKSGGLIPHLKKRLGKE